MNARTREHARDREHARERANMVGKKEVGMKRARSVVPSEEEYATSGPLTTIFGNPVGRVLDQSLYVGNMEQTISMLAESTNLSYKTVQSVVERLEPLGFIKASRKIGNAQAYRFEVEHDLHGLIKFAQEFQAKRLARQE